MAESSLPPYVAMLWQQQGDVFRFHTRSSRLYRFGVVCFFLVKAPKDCRVWLQIVLHLWFKGGGFSNALLHMLSCKIKLDCFGE